MVSGILHEMYGKQAASLVVIPPLHGQTDACTGAPENCRQSSRKSRPIVTIKPGNDALSRQSPPHVHRAAQGTLFSARWPLCVEPRPSPAFGPQGQALVRAAFSRSRAAFCLPLCKNEAPQARAAVSPRSYTPTSSHIQRLCRVFSPEGVWPCAGRFRFCVCCL